MDREGRLEHRDVLIRGDRIESLSESTGEAPEGVRIVEGRGRFLLPGLCDMHVHNWYAEEHVLFLANGVTTIRNMWGSPQHLRWARAIREGERLGPTLHTTGPILDGSPPIWQGSVVVTTPSEARAAVQRQAAAGYPALKVYNRLSPETYAAIVEEAQARGLRVEGHVPAGVGVETALASGQRSIEHLDGCFRWGAEFDPVRTADLARRSLQAGAAHCPTLVVYRKVVPAEEARKLRTSPEMRFVPPRLAATWDPDRDFRFKDLGAMQFAMVQRTHEVRLRIVKGLHDAGVVLLAGTDAGNPFVVSGWSLHEELALLVGAGLTPQEALVAATRAPAAYLRSDAGVIAAGKRADLVLLEADPLLDISHTRRIAGVMVRGRWMPREELAERLEEVAASYEQPTDRFAEAPPMPEGAGAAYEVSWNDLVVGQERFVIAVESDGSRTLHVQQVNDPPQATFKEIRIRLDREGRFAGADGEIEGRAGSRRWTVVADQLPRTALLGTGTVSGWWYLRKRFAGLAVAEVVKLDYRDSGSLRKVPLTVQREPGEGDRTIYSIWLEERDGTFRSRLEFDEQGWPIELTTVLQQGTVRFRRVQER